MLLIDKYAYFNRLKYIHPVEKVTLALSLLFFSLAVKDINVSVATFLVMSGCILLGAKVPLNYYIKLLLLPSLFLTSGIVTVLISFAGIETSIQNQLWSVSAGDWKLYISRDNAAKAIQLSFVTFSSLSCLYFLILTTPVHDILQIFRRLKMPGLLIEIMELTYRFIFVFLETASQIYQSQQSRLGYQTGKRWLYSTSLLISALFMSVFKRSRDLTHAMESRAYIDEINYADHNYQLSISSWLAITLILAAIFMVYMV